MGTIQPFTWKMVDTQVFVGLHLSSSSFPKFHFRDIICTGALVLQCGIGKKYWNVRWRDSSLVDNPLYKSLWDSKSVTVASQGFISEKQYSGTLLLKRGRLILTDVYSGTDCIPINSHTL